MKVRIIADISDDMLDPDDPTGVTEASYGDIVDALVELGMDDIEIRVQGSE